MNNAALISAAGALAGVVVYLYLGWRLSRRKVSPQTRLPAVQFSLFWVCLAAASAITGFESLVAAFQAPSLAVVLTLLYLEVLILCLLLWALIGYLTFLYTGRQYILSLAALYGLLYVLLLYFVTASGPDTVTVTLGVVGLGYQTQVGGPILGVLLLILVVPEFLCSILYFSLFFRTRDPTVRYRVLLVSWSLLGWFTLSFVNLGARLGGGLMAEALSNSLGLVTAAVIILAYYPTHGLRTRFGVTGIEEVPRATGS